jgi:hypothetical protein
MEETKTIKVRKKRELRVVKQDEVSTFISQAIEHNLPVETMERLFNLQREYKADKAKEAFVQALSTFQSEVPVIKKTKNVLNKDGTLRYQYAPIDSVIEQIKKPLSENGLSYNWDSAREEQHIKVICKLTHIGGHSELSTFDIPIEQSQYMTSPQSYATAQSYAKRYTLLNVLGIATAEEDTDATDANNNKDAKNEKARIVFLLRRLGEKTSTKEEIKEAISRIAQLDLSEVNFPEIISRLEISVNEKQGL